MKTTNHLSLQHCQQNWVTFIHEWLRINCLARARIMHRQATLLLFVLQQHHRFIALLGCILTLHQVSSTSSPPFWTGVTYRWGGVEGLGNTCSLHAGTSEMPNMVLKILPAFQKKPKVAPYCWWYLSYYSKKYIRCTMMFFSLSLDFAIMKAITFCGILYSRPPRAPTFLRSKRNLFSNCFNTTCFWCKTFCEECIHLQFSCLRQTLVWTPKWNWMKKFGSQL